MNVVCKVGTMLNIPVGTTGFTVTSSDPTIIATSNANNTVALTALKAGTSTITLKLANDLSVCLAVRVA